MSLADELAKLDELRQRGALSGDEFERAKQRLLEPSPAPAVQAINSFRRSRDDRWVGGVCGGLGRATGAQSWVWRLVFALLLFVGGSGLLLYVLLWIFVPSD